MKLIIGLGNFEDKYLFTRHNAGFIMADFFARTHNQTFKQEKKLKSLIAKFKLNDEDIILVKPLTYMNLSGEAVAAVMNFYKIPLKDVLVIYDDISLDLGVVRFRSSGSDGGHNGIKSIIGYLGTTQFDRLKIGIGPQPNIPSEAYVLQNFTQDELNVLKKVLKKPMIEDYLKDGMEKVQNAYN
ncbi:MAG: aminoacyl-tRNA hydrolase [Lutibacter sp.]|nr:aminoacyl-tRNA hydrolase [Lutibacter sp.]